MTDLPVRTGELSLDPALRAPAGYDNNSGPQYVANHLERPPPSSREWKQRGAATVVSAERDANGNVTTKVIKKGVEDFVFGKTLGEGSYSTVMKATDKQTQREYAVKVLDKRHIIKEKKVKYVNIEKNTLNRLGDHPGVIRLYYTFQDQQSLYFVLDFAPNGELLTLIKQMGSLDIDCTRYYAAQLLDAIEFMHSKGVVHRDLKPENILLDEKMRIRITDFGTAKLMNALRTTEDGQPVYPEDVRANSFVGTAEYVSPELLTEKATGKSCDIWAFGCIIFQMIAGRAPFKAANEYQIFQKVIKLQYSYPPGFPTVVRNLLNCVLVLDPTKRARIEDIKRHEFFAGVHWNDLKSIWKRPPPRLQPFKPVSSRTSSAAKLNALSSSRPQLSHYNSQPQLRAVSASQSSPKRRNPSSYPNNEGHVSSATAAAAALNKQQQQQQQLKQQQSQQQLQQAKSSPPQAKPPLQAKPVSAPQPSSQQQQQQRQQVQPQPQQPQQANPTRPRIQIPTTDSVHITSPTSPYQQPPLRTQKSSSQVAAAAAISNGHSNPPQPVQQPSSQTEPSPTEDYPMMEKKVKPRREMPPHTTLDTEWNHVLISYNERVLRVGHISVITTNNGSATGEDEEEKEPSKFAKFFSGPKKKKRILLVTSNARLLILGEDRKIRVEIPIAAPQVSIREYPFNRKTNCGSFGVETHNKVYTFEDSSGSAEWMASFEEAIDLYNQQMEEQSSSRFATAVTAAALAASHHAPTSQHAPTTVDSTTSTLLARNEEWRKKR
ncbi:serine/threonine-protein kinase Pkh1p [Trichomonascus vanleenenianus]|uniref:PDPK1 family serine/threonine-protein kinase n=1 Tax=Trichomonascus vanleenenianus TaxID=2268995 RepID=UPI003EC98F24